MDGSAKRQRVINPGHVANITSKITFFFAFWIFRRTAKNDFKDEDVYEPIIGFSSKTLGNKLENHWNIEKKKEKPNIFTSICKVFWTEYAFWGLVVMIINTSSMIIKPLLIGKIVSYFSPGQSRITKEATFMYASLLIACIFASTVFTRSYSFIIKQLSLKVKIACTTLIYQKLLKLNQSLATQATAGQAVTLITKDIVIFDTVMTMTHQTFTGAVQIIAMTYMMYMQIGVSAFVGVSVILLFILIQAIVGSKTLHYRLATSKKTDERLQLIQEILSTIRVIKMYTWERFFYKLVDKLRKKEIHSFQILMYLKMFNKALGILNGRLALYSCVITFVALGNHITAEKAFVITGCFTALRTVLYVYIPLGFVKIAELKAMLMRLGKYLLQDEVNDNRLVEKCNSGQIGISIKDLTISYGNKIILENVTISINPGITLILGAVGSGKSSLLSALLGDVAYNGTVRVFGKVAYASQEPWIFPGTVRQNIVFNESFNKERYDNVVRICALQKDFDSFCAGDRMLLSDKGLNLSNGQKMRINLARAVYKQADIYLLDDCLSAVDLQVGKHIFSECIKGFLKNKVCLLVSHLQQFVSDSDEVILLTSGRVELNGIYKLLKENVVQNHGIKDCVTEDNEITTRANPMGVDSNMPTQDATKNIYEESNERGAVKKDVYFKYFKAGGVKLFLVVVILIILKQASESWSDYFIRFWVESEQKLSSIKVEFTANSTEYQEEQESHNGIMKQYSLVIFTALVFVALKSFMFYMFTSRASIRIHREIVDKILNASMAFFNKNLAGNIINRFSRDFSVVDEHLPLPLLECMEVTLTIAAILVVVSSINTWFLIPSACFTLILYIGRRLYLPSGRNIRRIEGSTRSPMIGHMQATFEGLRTIRASGAQDIVKNEFNHHQDIYNSAQYMHLATVEAFIFYMDMFTGCYIASIVFALPFFENSMGAGKVGLAITQSFALTGLIQWCILQWTEIEVQMTSTERVLEYTKIETENKSGNIVKFWPSTGKVVFKDVKLRYSENSECVLNNVNFSVKTGQKIGIVGRTGAGKSSLVSVLFRLYAFEGTISVDDVDIHTLEVEELRSKISILPQDPVLFSGSIRFNLDPESQYTDKQLWRALEEVKMQGKIESLDQSVTENTTIFSVGQKQLICLARIILQNNLVLVLDEATANVDAETDTLIQLTIKRIFVNRTIITIAHRLHTIMDCDKILVMDTGAVCEYGHPNILLQNENGIFYAMTKDAGLLPLKKLIPK